MWNSRRVKRIVESFSVVTVATLGLSLTEVVEENTYAPISFEVIDKAMAQTKYDLENVRVPQPIHRMASYYGSPEFFKQKQEQEEARLRILRERQEQEEIKRNQEREEKERERKEREERIMAKIEAAKNKEGNKNENN